MKGPALEPWPHRHISGSAVRTAVNYKGERLIVPAVWPLCLRMHMYLSLYLHFFARASQGFTNVRL